MNRWLLYSVAGTILGIFDRWKMTFYADRLSTGFMLQLYVDRKQLAIVLGRLRLTWVRR